MSNIVRKPLGRIDTPDGPLYVDEIDGCRVHGSKPLTPESAMALSEMIAGVRAMVCKCGHAFDEHDGDWPHANCQKCECIYFETLQQVKA